MQEEPAIGLYLDTRHPSKKHDDKFPVKVRITWQVYDSNHKAKWDPRYLRTGQYVTATEFDILKRGEAKSSRLREQQAHVFKVRAQATTIIKENKRIGIDAFFYEYDKRYSGGSERARNPALVSALFDELIEEKTKSDDLGTEASYTNAKNSILKFGGDQLLITDVTTPWLRKYEMWMVDDHGLSLNTVGFYLRPLRSICRRAVKRKMMNETQYPFGKDRYVIRKKRVKKKALPTDVKDKILGYKPDTKHRLHMEGQAKAIDFTMFTYIAHGMNMTDIAHLHETDIRGDHFVFVRRKTRKTTTEVKEIKIPLNKYLREIIQRRGTHKGYVFGVITENMDALTRRRIIKNWIRNINKIMRRIAKQVGYDGKLSTYSWRHSFVSTLLNAGVPITKVKDAVGWQNLAMVQEYAEDLDLETATKFTDMLIKH